MVDFEEEMLKHMLKTNTQLGAIHQRMEAGERIQNDIRVRLDNCTTAIAELRVNGEKVTDLEARIQDCEETSEQVKKMRWYTKGVVAVLGLFGAFSLKLHNTLDKLLP